VVDASILIPTFRHVRLLPFALASALDQQGVSVEVLVVGDGVEDGTREVLARFADDPRIRFFDFPKGPRNGEAYRHEVLQEARGRIVAYLCDDDLLLVDHVATMSEVLADSDFAHPVTTRFTAEGELEYFPWNYERAEFREVGRNRKGSMGLTGVAHTLEAYRRLPHGWRTTPDGMPTDHYMWLQWLEAPGVRMALSERNTYLNFPDPFWRELPEDERARVLSLWFERSREPGFAEQADTMLAHAVRRAAEDYHLWAWRERNAAEELRGTRTWRARERLLAVRRRR
jgi:GalNAc5-diNAcBac-PP-undecaprenol beta-1,3-glucosyltransferase